MSVPAHDRYTLAPKASRFCVAVFCINEGERIQAQLRRMADLSGTVDLIVADGGSTDGSLPLDFLSTCGVRVLLVKRGPGRLSAQMRMAIAFALEEEYEGIIVIDGNDKDDVRAIPRFAELLAAGYDHIQGSRYIPGGQGIRTPLARSLGVRLLHAPLMSMAARHRYTDTTNGFRGYSARLLSDPRVLPLRDVFMGYELHYYLAIRAARLGFRVIETPVTRAYPESGSIPTKIHGLRGNLSVLRTLWAAVRGAYDPVNGQS